MSAVRTVMKNYARNTELDEFLEKELAQAGYGGSDIQRSPLGTKVTVYVTRPGIVIGRRGLGIRALTERLEKKFELQNPQISVLEVEVPDLNPKIMCSRIANTVTRGTAFRRTAIWALNSIMGAGAMGAEIVISGKLRSDRSHHEKYVSGIVPKSGDTAEKIVSEATVHVLLKMGLYGVKVRIARKGALEPEVKILEKPVDSEESKEEMEVAETAPSENGRPQEDGKQGTTE